MKIVAVAHGAAPSAVESFKGFVRAFITIRGLRLLTDSHLRSSAPNDSADESTKRAILQYMMKCDAEPAAMPRTIATPSLTLIELAEVLATGYRRLAKKGRNVAKTSAESGLDLLAQESPHVREGSA